MKSIYLAVLVSVAACGGNEPPAASPSTRANPGPGAASRQNTDSAGRALTRAECDSLGQWLAQSCESRARPSAAQVDGWCGDVVRSVGDGSWQSDDCVKHIKYVDSVCFRSATSAGELMDCDRNVDR